MIIDEIQDAMERTSGRVKDEDNEYSLSWALVMVSIAYEIDQHYAENLPINKKKVDTSEESPETKS